ncbi:MAG: right-handed parallel beta-helix repeat-containing protein, partial [Rubrivivax sp.]|nr:right-handed parallel beta-helix repeat-containing protein [Rubrivivax sp.]
NVTLHLEEGAVLRASTDLTHYDRHEWGHHDDITPWHFLYADGAENIALTGRGTLDGSGPAFWEPERRNAWAFFVPRKFERPSPMIEFTGCRHVLVEGVHIQDSPGWTLHGHDCDHLRVEGVTIRNSFFAPNGDGIDLTGCRDVIIHGCDISCGDDAIALKTSEFSRSCERVAVSDCILRTSCVGIRIGYESREDFRDIVVTNMLIPRCTRAIDLRAVEGATIERVRFSNITACTDGGWPATRAIEVIQLDRPNIFKALLSPEHPHYGQDRPLKRPSVIRDVSFSGLDVTTDGRITVVGKPGQPVEGVRFSDVRLRFPVLDDATPFRDAQSTSFIPGDYADARAANAAFVVQHARDVEIEGLRLRWPTFPVGPWHLFESDNRLMSSFWKGNEEKIRAGEHRVPYHVLWARDAEIAVAGRH